MGNEMKARGVDVPIEDLVPLHERDLDLHSSRGYRRILASIRELGLIEPLCVYQQNGLYVILDGFLRYKACRELSVTALPCLVFPDKEAYTFNRMVNHLSYSQEAQMLRKSLETVDERTVAKVLGLKSIKRRLDTSLLSRLHPAVAAALDKGTLAAVSAGELTYVKPERQAWILSEMARTGDYSSSFARALVLRTPVDQRSSQRRYRTPWDSHVNEKQQLVAKLEAAEKRYEFYTGLYRQYSFDLLRLCIFVRKLTANERIRVHLETNAADVLRRFERILFETQAPEEAPVDASGTGDAAGP